MRIQLDIPSAGAEQAKSLMKTAGFKTWTEFFNNASALLQWAVKHTQSGDVIVAYDESRNKMKELVMPFLQNLGVNNSRVNTPDVHGDSEERLASAYKEIERLQMELQQQQSRAANSGARGFGAGAAG